MKREHMPFQYMKQFKAVAADYEYYLTLSDKPVSVCLTERQMYILSVWNTYTPWMTRWYNTDDTSEAELRAIAAEIEDLLMCGCGVPVPSITDVLNAQTYNNSTTENYITTYNTWNTAGQTVASIAPNLDYSTGDPVDIDKLLCLGLELYLTVIVEQAKGIKAGELQDAKDLTKQLANVFGALGVAGGAALGVGGVAAGFVGFFGGPWLVLGLALAAVGMTVANIVFPMDLSVFTDPVAFEAVYCTMVTNMVGATPTRSAFQGALTPNTFTPGSNAAQLASVVQPYLDSLDSYLQFLVAMNGLYDVSDFGLLPDCGCTPPPDPNCLDFTTSRYDWDEEAGGTWTSSIGFRGFYNAGFNATVLRAFRDVSSDFAQKIVYKFNSPITNVLLYQPSSSFALYYTGSPTDEIEFSALTFPGSWTDVNLALGLALDYQTTGDVSTSLAFVEACIYLVA